MTSFVPFRNTHRWLALTGSALLLAACALPGSSDKSAQSTDPERWPQIDSPFDPAKNAAIEAKIDALMAQMTLEQKIGQMTQAEISRTTPEDVKKYHLGSVLNGGGGFLDGNKHATVDDWLKALDAYYEASMDTSDGGLAIPIMWGTDAVHGHNKIVGATLFPHNIGLGATRNKDLVREISAITAKQVRVTGMDWTFSPALSVVRNDRWGRTYEGYSEDPDLVAQLGAASILGYQGDLTDKTFMSPDHITATAKHFLADGGTENGIDRGNNTDSEQDLIAIHGEPYFAALRAGVLTVMASHSSWHGERMHGHEYLLTDVLKNRLGFDGFIVGDWNSHGLVEGCTNTRCPEAVNAGMDMLMVPFDWKEFIDNTLVDVREGRIPMARIDDAVRRILRVKFHSGLMDAGKPSERRYAGQKALLNAPQFQKVAQQAVRESLVLLKNNNQTLPLKPNLKVVVAGKGADNIPMQSGGWTISWQATDLTNKDFPNATSIFKGIEKTVQEAGGKAELAVDGNYKSKPDVAIVVYGEPPYAEWQGDVRHLGFQLNNNQNAKLLEKFKAEGIPTVSVFLSGRPMWVNRELNASDAFVAAWLPGTEGAGVADLLFADAKGKPRYDFTGKLSYSWPASPLQAEVNLGDDDYQPLFPFGYGLSYASGSGNLAPLPTDVDLKEAQEDMNVVLFDGRAQEPWQMQIAVPGSAPVRYLSGIAKNGPLSLTEADQNTQGDAVNALWQGGAKASLEINYPNANRNFTELLEQNTALAFDIRLLQPASGAVKVEMACRGGQCGQTPKPAHVDVTSLINVSPIGDWNEISVSLDCFAEQGILFEEIARAFGMSTEGSLELQLTNIRLQPGTGDKAGVQCQAN